MFHWHEWVTRWTLALDDENAFYKYRHCLICDRWQKFMGKKFLFFARWEDSESIDDED